MLKNLLIIILITMFLSLSVYSQEKRFGVFVGVGNYPEKTGLDSLESSVNDANEMCKAFSQKCGKDNTELLLNEEATRQNILQSIIKFQKLAGRGDLFVFYYSGHGTLFPDRLSEDLDEDLIPKVIQKGGRLSIIRKSEMFDSALIPYDSTENSDNKIWHNLILDDELYRLFAGFTKQGVRVVFISDSCYAGGQAKSLKLAKNKKSKLGKPKSSDWKKAIGIVNESEIPKKLLIQTKFKYDPSFEKLYILVASSLENESSFPRNPYTGSDMSLFTYFFLNVFNEYKKLKKPFTFETINNVIKPKVMSEARDNDESQTPYIDTSFYKGDLGGKIF